MPFYIVILDWFVCLFWVNEWVRVSEWMWERVRMNEWMNEWLSYIYYKQTHKSKTAILPDQLQTATVLLYKGWYWAVIQADLLNTLIDWTRWDVW